MPLLKATSNGVVTDIELPADQKLLAIVHQNGIKVDVPEYVRIDCRKTIKTMEQMNQKQWEWISQADIFKNLFNIVFHDITLPNNINDLNEEDMGVVHVVGMIVLGCEACFESKSCFFVNPETFLHPKAEQRIISMFNKMLEMCGSSGVVVDADGNETKVEKIKYETTPELVIKWLQANQADKNFVSYQNKPYSYSDCIPEVENKTTLGLQVIDLFSNLYNQ